ncbi:hypothetical protein [Desulfatitalea alkaliphila]|uniref:Uncharacterized protein n=1 Tax=Desulfatitalea alkaliphila TaxID=2929485 RepID=A0AA41R4I8_9BACT|nr:hypothetical protein [Desulfatitalea alkaliphila]MCJ8501378.1 hypothetical protein [Desulfatitalea alkaliphila]
MQRTVLGLALDMLERAWSPCTTVRAPFTWSDDRWRQKFMRVDDANREALARAGEERRRLQERMKPGKP